MDFKTATTRLRRTFAYPSDTTTTSPSSSHHFSDSDSDGGGPALDEQEQEELIRSLAEQNAARNAQFRIFLLALPTISTLPYLIVLYNSLSHLVSRTTGPGNEGGKRTSVADIWISLLALSSLASTAWTLWSLPPGVTGIRVLDAWVGSSSTNTTTTNSTTTHPSSSSSSSAPQQHGLLGGANAQRRRRASAVSSQLFFWAQRHRSPLQQYLPFLNIALCSLLVLAGLLSSRRSTTAVARHWGHVGLANLPALIYVVVLVAKMLMGSIDPEKELSALRYEYKGA
ncbi:hypothetical protein RRF57_006995 [Xylaria bambusicola]|uniref:Uncharacterized protein n=1 Tax=Xylaria bambusicola TaxID=326684 RepID=A0AAN7ZA51_9PEZI